MKIIYSCYLLELSRLFWLAALSNNFENVDELLDSDFFPLAHASHDLRLLGLTLTRMQPEYMALLDKTYRVTWF